MPSSANAQVVDASFVVRLLQPGHPEVVDLWQTWIDAGATIHAPTLILFEVTNALYRIARAAGLSSELLVTTLEEFDQLDLELAADLSLARRAAELAWALDLPAAYDGHYLALAERLDVTLWTGDEKLAKRVAAKKPRLNLTVRLL